MKQEDKELLLRYLSMALPYGIKILHEGWDSDGDCEFSSVETLIGINDRFIFTLWRGEKDKHSIIEPLSILDYKPFLRPMSSMTEEEKKEYNKTCIAKFIKAGAGYRYDGWWEHYDTIASFDWLNAQHFDYRGLIEKGLAIAVTEENNPYNIKEE